MSRPSMASRFHPTRRVTVAALTMLLLGQTAGCFTWHPVADPIPKLTSAKPTDSYRVTLVNGEVVQLTKLSVRGDSVLGMADSLKLVRGSMDAVPYPVGFPVSLVARVQRHSVNAGSYLGFLGFVFAGLGALAGMIAGGGGFNFLG